MSWRRNKAHTAGSAGRKTEHTVSRRRRQENSGRNKFRKTKEEEGHKSQSKPVLPGRRVPQQHPSDDNKMNHTDVAGQSNHLVRRSKVAAALVRELKAPREVAYVILCTIRSLVADLPGLFSPHVRSFYVAGTEPAFIRDAKLDVLSALATDETADAVLREMESCVYLVAGWRNIYIQSP